MDDERQAITSRNHGDLPRLAQTRSDGPLTPDRQRCRNGAAASSGEVGACPVDLGDEAASGAADAPLRTIEWYTSPPIFPAQVRGPDPVAAIRAARNFYQRQGSPVRYGGAIR